MFKIALFIIKWAKTSLLFQWSPSLWWLYMQFVCWCCRLAGPGQVTLIFRVRLFERCSLVDSLTLKMGAVRSFETSVTLYQSTRCHIIEVFAWRYKLWKLGTAVTQWLRCCATNLKVAGSIPAGVIGIFHWHSNRTMALGSTQPLTEMSTRYISWG